MSDNPVSARTLPQVVVDAASRYGARLAIIDGTVQLTYEELDRARVAAAKAFIAAGIEQGDRFAIWAPNIHQWIVAAIGAQSVGAVLVPLNTRYKGSEAAYIIRSSGARMLFTVGEFLGVSYPEMLADQALPELERTVLLDDAAVGGQSWTSFLAAGESVVTEEVARRAALLTPEDTLDSLVTSGTTVNPKGVVTAHGQNIRTF